MKTLGVIGGMGPLATTAFLQRLQALTPATRDEDHIRVLMDLHPGIPNRHSHPDGASAVIGAMAERLVAMGAEVLAMPCNTAHAHAGRVRAAGAPFIDMVEETSAEAVATGGRRVGILATPGGERLYRAALEARGAQAVVLEGADRDAFMHAVFAAKGGDLGAANRTVMRRLAEQLAASGADHLIGGCTEVPLLLSAEEAPLPLTDSAEVLALMCVRTCTEQASHDSSSGG